MNKGTSTIATHRRGPYGRLVQPSPGLQPPAPATWTASPLCGSALRLRLGDDLPDLDVDFPGSYDVSTLL